MSDLRSHQKEVAGRNIRAAQVIQGNEFMLLRTLDLSISRVSSSYLGVYGVTWNACSVAEKLHRSFISIF